MEERRHPHDIDCAFNAFKACAASGPVTSAALNVYLWVALSKEKSSYSKSRNCLERGTRREDNQSTLTSFEEDCPWKKPQSSSSDTRSDRQSYHTKRSKDTTSCPGCHKSWVKQQHRSSNVICFLWFFDALVRWRSQGGSVARDVGSAIVIIVDFPGTITLRFGKSLALCAAF